jgi:hypothetical protein
MIVRREDSRIAFELNGVAVAPTPTAGATPAPDADLPPLSLCTDGTVTEFCSVIAEGS